MSRQNDSSHKVLKGAVILTAAALIVKILSAVYRIPFQNMAGDTGFYIYQQVYPFYGIAVVLATYGFPVGISKLLIEFNRSGNDKKEKNKIIAASFIWVALFGIILFLFLYLGADLIAKIMNDIQLAPLIRMVAFSFLLMPFISIVRGTYQASGNMLPTALSQTFEQLFRVTFILIGTYLLMKFEYSLYTVGKSAIAGSLIGGIAAMGVLGLYLWRERRDYFPTLMPEKEILIKTGAVLLFQGLAFCLSNMYLLLLQLIDSFQLYTNLLSQGIPAEEAKAMKGVYDRGQPLIQVGLVVATSLSLSIVPVLTSLQKSKAIEEVKKMCRLAIKISSAIGVGAAIGLAGIIQSVNIMLFKDDEGVGALSVLAILILFASLLVTCSTILQTMGFWKASVMVILLSVGIKVLLNPWLIAGSGIKGAAYASLLALMAACILLLYLVGKYITGRNMEFHHIASLVIAGIVMYIVLKGYSALLSFFVGELGQSRILASIHALSSVAIGGMIYLYMLLKMNLFENDELAHLLGGHHLIRIMNKGKIKR
ncbi:polysaccharide biosynthesis protein [Bacillus sp. E214]|uniref:putative polysaccharide biosynthesis protein n=1 Tax=Bacillus sp. E214 TaxID=2587156 RepID=UPI0011E004B9|nr:polysaccharide biosynthesis protein [Bacillus sp. E214]